ncbi:protein cramped isoform X2 [Eupeodes corollae]|uniref:protein cramped isoform X2 n=1 Tax=Eupeodes corollae TaxID=290404 RepID=UPI00248FD841|nr:protein cramped isoform X2 [Eupeodes corollae]
MQNMDLAKALTFSTIKTEALATSPIKTEEKTNSIDTLKTSSSGKVKSNLDEKFKLEIAPFGELLGSVTTHNCPGVRASARVIQKMKQDSIRPSTPPPTEKDLKAKDDKAIQKTPSQPKPPTKATWTNIERNYFFDALSEFGKEFDAIGNYINAKLKRKSATDAAFKTKDQVRQHFYQTFHKLSRYIRFSDEVKKPVQELYTLINYGEMRRKLPFITDKHFMKLKHLVYYGHITIRSKGKNIRIKTPTCKALRRLNQLDVDSLEDIKLPNKVEVIVSPANMESFGRVQILAQNPRAKATVSLQKKLVNFIKTFQHKWRSNEMKLAEEEPKLFPSNSTNESETVSTFKEDSDMCFRPKPGVPIHRPLLNITEYISSQSLSLSTYEDRIGVKVRSESLCQDRLMSNKRLRCDSNSDKRSPESKKLKTNDHLTESGFSVIKEESSAQQQANENENSNNDGNLSDEINEILNFTELKCDNISEVAPDNDIKATEESHHHNPQIENGNSQHNEHLKDQSASSVAIESKGKGARKRRGEHKKNDTNFKPLISDDVIKKIRKGWTTSNADDITIGDLYVVFGQDSKLEFEYFWTNTGTQKKNIFNQKQNGMPYSINDCDEPQLINSLTKSTLGNKLKHLLLIANLSERVRKKQCSCGHTCDKMLKPRLDREIVTKSFVSSKTFQLSTVDSGVFRQPVVPLRRPTYSLDPIKQLPNGSRLKMSKQVLVQRMLLPHRSGQAYDVVDVKNLQNKLVNRKESASTTNGISSTPTAASSDASSPMTSITSEADDEEQQVEIVDSNDQANSITPESGIDTCPDSPPSANDQATSNETTFLNDQPSESIEFDECSTSSIFKGIPPLSPMQLLRDSTSNSRWLEENLNDFSLNSLLGHLDEINGNRDITDQSSNLSVLSETSVDYMTKFAEITASMQNEEKDL